MSIQVKGFALSGKIGAGKSTVCQKIIAEYGPERAALVSFAAPLKQLAIRMLNRPIEKARDRKLLQAIGMGMRSNEIRSTGIHALVGFLLESHPDILEGKETTVKDRGHFITEILSYCDRFQWGYKDHWADQLPRTVKELQAKGIEYFVIEDMRFLNEYRVAKALGMKSVRVECDESVRLSRLVFRDGSYDTRLENDISEQEWPLIPYDMILRTEDENHAQETIRRWIKGEAQEETCEIIIS